MSLNVACIISRLAIFFGVFQFNSCLHEKLSYKENFYHHHMPLNVFVEEQICWVIHIFLKRNAWTHVKKEQTCRKYFI